MKKLFSVLCAAALCFTALTSCNKEEELKPLNPSFPSVAEGLLEISSADSLVVPFVIGEAKGNLVDVSAVSTNSLYNTKVEVAENNKEGNITIYAPEYILDATEFDVEVNIKDEENAREVKTIFTVTPKLYDNIITADKPANCYVATSGAVVNFPANIGNTAEKAGVVKLELLWQDEAGLVSKVISCENGIATVAFAKEKTGNAVFVGKNADANVVWSWHVWVLNELPKDQTVAGFTFMDRALGAVDASYGSDKSVGTFYQWGRKDAFAGTDYNNGLKKMYDIDGNEVQRELKINDQVDNRTNAIANPLTHYWANYVSGTTNAHAYTWFTTDFAQFGEAAATFWSKDGKKTENDPCPAGYKVATAAAFTAVKASGTAEIVLDDKYQIPAEVSSSWQEQYVAQYTAQAQLRGVKVGDFAMLGFGYVDKDGSVTGSVGAAKHYVVAHYWTSDFKSTTSASSYMGIYFNGGASYSSKEGKFSSVTFAASSTKQTSQECPVRCVKE